MIKMIGVSAVFLILGSSAVAQNRPQRETRCAAVTLSCAVSEEGVPSDCQILAEDAPGRGFGESALESMREARFRPNQPGDVNERAVFTVRYRRDDVRTCRRRPSPRTPPAPNHAVPFPEPPPLDQRPSSE
ncbi:MAG: energy transducer TonB [Brevundimonas sp.]|nr:MAG: energy transducer TonB [Brevundimonas sp.]